MSPFKKELPQSPSFTTWETSVCVALPEVTVPSRFIVQAVPENVTPNRCQTFAEAALPVVQMVAKSSLETSIEGPARTATASPPSCALPLPNKPDAASDTRNIRY